MKSQPTENDFFADVRPKGWLGGCLERIQNPRKWRWNAYLRACRAIPKTSPVYGSTTWEEINERRLALVGAKARQTRNEAEFRALQRVCDEFRAGSLVAQNFLMARKLRQWRRQHGKA